jgi:hypothetical protein
VPAASGETTWARAAFSSPRLGQKRPNEARLDRDRRIKINGFAWISADQNPSTVSPPKTLALIPMWFSRIGYCID